MTAITRTLTIAIIPAGMNLRTEIARYPKKRKSPMARIRASEYPIASL